MSIKKHLLPIFLLYIISSFIFLTLILTLYYKDNVKRIEFECVSFSKQIALEIGNNFRFNDVLDISSFENLKDIKINIFDNNDQKFIYKNHETIDFTNSINLPFDMKEFSLKIQDDILYLKLNLFKRGHRRFMHHQNFIPPYYVSIENREFKLKKHELILKILLIFVVSFIFFMIISYFIIKICIKALLEKINLLNSFIADTTHEINTPLSVILMSIEMFENNPKKYLCNIKIASKTLSNLYNDLVLLNLKSSPNNIEKIDLKEIINERILYFSQLYSSKNLRIISNLDSVFLQSDRAKFEKVFDNLFSNAIKYSDEGCEILLNLNNSEFSILNYGEGIKKENIDKIFDKFSRFNSQTGGFGIGLSLVKKYCNELGFKITASSKNSQTEFKILF